MKTFTANITVTLRRAILDVQGKAVENALHSLHMPGFSDVRIGKHIELSIQATDAEAASAQLREACDKLLTNPVMEDYHFTLNETAAVEAA
ncbi:MAG: phosphoribosylformylglycinamidine synthase subunit PurS [Bacteroidota bacterium]|jgi:phosphoribosylformylglycinamidine synthase